jgi:hypothetical protein
MKYAMRNPEHLPFENPAENVDPGLIVNAIVTVALAIAVIAGYVVMSTSKKRKRRR